MKQIAIILALALPVGLAFAGPAELVPLPTQGEPLAMRPARLTVQNDGPSIAEAVLLRSRQGGPSVLAKATIPPGQRGVLAVELPVLASRQEFVIKLLADGDAGSPPIAQATATIDWPGEIDTQKFLHPRNQMFAAERPAWPQSLKSTLAIILIAGVLLCGSGLLAKPGLARIGIVVFAVIGMSIATALMLHRMPTVTVQAGMIEGRLVLAAGAMRTTIWRHEGRFIPLYLTAEQMRQDEMVIESGRVSIPLRPGQVRLLEQVK